MDNIIDAIFVPDCLFCKSTGSVFCRKCLQRCQILPEGFCIVCEKRSIEGVTHTSCQTSATPCTIFSAFKYEGLVRNCIKRSKYGAKSFASLKKLVKEGVSFTSKCGKTWQDHVVVPIPLSNHRFRERGFNQAELISQEICRQFNLKIDNYILTRKKETNVQFKSNRAERFLNLQNAFLADATKARAKKLLLVDDICTSGATLLEAAACLRATGCQEVNCFTLARRL